MKEELVDRIISNPTDRRKFFKRVGATGIGIAAASMLGGSLGIVEAATSSITDVDILNFALNLEYLEAEFYSVAVLGKTLEELGILTASEVSGPTTGGAMVNFSETPGVIYIANGLVNDEQKHVEFLRKALGSAAVKKPAINLDALGYGFAGLDSFLKLGAAPLIKSKAYLAAAGAILATEAQHSGAIREECVNHGVVSPAVDSLDVPPTKQTPFCVDSNALSIPRTTSQVLNIVYGGGSCSGGFYPDGMNGAIVCQS